MNNIEANRRERKRQIAARLAVQLEDELSSHELLLARLLARPESVRERDPDYESAIERTQLGIDALTADIAELRKHRNDEIKNGKRND